jgi:nucleoside-diphosphate-sugar epimerase
LDESRAAAPASLYGISKLTGELLCREWGDTHSLDVRVTRLSNVYGRYERETASSRGQSLPYLIALDLISGYAPDVGTAAHDWTYMGDAACGVADVLDAGALEHDTYNVSTGVAVSDALVVDAITATLTRRGMVPPLKVPRDRTHAAPVRGVLAVERLASDVGYAASPTLEHGVDALVGWLLTST